MISRNRPYMRIDHLSNLFGPAVAVEDFERSYVGFVEVQGAFTERIVGFSWHDTYPALSFVFHLQPSVVRKR